MSKATAPDPARVATGIAGLDDIPGGGLPPRRMLYHGPCFFEASGAVHKAISVIKKRAGSYEKTIRELIIDPAGITAGPPLADFRGGLSGSPFFAAEKKQQRPKRGQNEKAD